MYRITVLSNKPLSFYVTKDGRETLIRDAGRGRVAYTDMLTDALRIYQEDRKVKITELRSDPAREKKETSVAIPVKGLFDSLPEEINLSEPAKKRRKQRANKNIAEE